MTCLILLFGSNLLEFVASLTRDPGEIKRFIRLWKEGGDPRNPFKNVLMTAIFTPPSTLELIRELKEQGVVEQVFFDSGGYFVQMGRITYEDMYWQLLQFYRANDWGDCYTLPDYVPLSSDDEEACWQKTRRTADGSRLFYTEMPDNLKAKALAVIQGRSASQIDYCLNTYLPLGIDRVGFGSFATNGKQSSANIVTQEALTLLSYVSEVLEQSQHSLHAFGVGTPPVIYLLDKIGVTSFDSIGWMKTAGFGKVYLPFVRAYNITYRDRSARGMTQQTFEELKERSGHQCAFCADFGELAANRNYRILHNLAAILDTLDLLKTNSTIDMLQVMQEYSPTYSRLGRSVN